MRELNEIVRGTEQFRRANRDDKLLQLPAGDGMALVFRDSPESPAQCAIEIHRALQTHSRLPIRMGIHSGPVNEVTDVNNRANIAGAGINMAQRVMDCGDVGHILTSKHVAEDLENHPRWQPHLHHLGECEVKHGVRLEIVNLYANEFGNSQLPEKIRRARENERQATRRRRRTYAFIVASLFIAAALIIGSWIFHRRTRPTLFNDSAAIPEKSIAVLPFENLSDDKQNAYFADGVQDEILTDLAKIADLKVISRTSVRPYKSGVARNLRQIGKELGVSHLLEGSVQRANGKVRVNAQLMDARSDAHVWAQTYDRDLTDVFAIQSEIAKTIAQQLQAKLSASEQVAIAEPPTSDLFAYDLYVHAKALFADVTDPVAAKQKLPQAVALLDQAVARDPQFIVAWCLLSRIHARIYSAGFDHTPARLQLAQAAIQSALRSQPNAGEGHLALANYYYQSVRDYERARSELAIAQRTLPNNPELFDTTGYIQRREGNWQEATRNLERAAELDPRNFHTLHQLALTYQAQRRYQDQARMYNRALAIIPGDPLTLILQALVAADWKADIQPFQRTLATLMAQNPQAAADVDDINYDLCERTPVATARGLQHYPRSGSSTTALLIRTPTGKASLRFVRVTLREHKWPSTRRATR